MLYCILINIVEPFTAKRFSLHQLHSKFELQNQGYEITVVRKNNSLLSSEPQISFQVKRVLLTSILIQFYTSIFIVKLLLLLLQLQHTYTHYTLHTK